MVVNWSGLLYQCDHVQLDHNVVPLDSYTPIDMRAAGAAWGVYALECAMDELAAKLAIDPIDLRLKYYAERDQNEDLPFSSKELRECYRQGAERFSWAQRNPQPRSMREGNALCHDRLAQKSTKLHEYSAELHREAFHAAAALESPS